MRNKRGQFYIVAAILIVLIIAGVASVRTYAIVQPKPRAIHDLGSELREESSRIVDYGIYNAKDLTLLLDNFTDTEFAPYFLQKTGETGIVFIYGNKSKLSAVQYKEQVTGTISATIGTGIANWPTASEFAERVDVTPIDPLEKELNVTLLGKSFRFDLKDNEMFYFVIVQEKEGEIYVERN